MSVSDWVVFRDPGIGTSAEELATNCGWQIRRQDGTLRVCTNENYLKRPTRQIHLALAADRSGTRQSVVADITRWGHADLYERLVEPSLIQNEIHRLTADGSREGGWRAHQLMFQVTPPDAFPGYFESACRALTADGLFPDLEVWTVRATPQLNYCDHVVRTLILAEHFPEEVHAVKRGHLSIEIATGQRSGGLTVPGRDRLTPVLAATAPWMLGFTFERIGGNLALLLGKPEYGKAATPAGRDLIEMLNLSLFESAAFPDKRDRPPVRIDETRAALQWWIERLDRVMAIEHDPASHQTDGIYDPVRHLTLTLTLDRLMTVVQQITIADRRNETLRKMLLFDALDLIEGLMPGQKFEMLTRLSKVKKLFQQIEAALPPTTHPVLLPRCRAAVDALREFQDGFWVPSTISADGTKVRISQGAEPAPRETAASRVLRVMRNGHHGYVHTDKDEQRLLTLHDGRIPNALPDLAFLHLLGLFAFPVRLDPARLLGRREPPA